MANKSVMLVEGDDDYHVFQHLMTAHGLDQQITWRLEPYGSGPRTGRENEIVFRERQGYNNVRDYLSQQLRITGDLKQLGVVVDADTDFAARWHSLRDVLVGAGYTDAPVQADVQGLILEHSEAPDEKPRVGVWMMPNNRDAGSMETSLRCFCRRGTRFGNGRGCVSSKSLWQSGLSRAPSLRPMSIPGLLGRNDRDCRWEKLSPRSTSMPMRQVRCFLLTGCGGCLISASRRSD